MNMNTLLLSGYIICGISETCCDSPGIGGICCSICQNCVGGACNPKTDNTVCGTGFKCCSGTCIDILNDDFNCGTCGHVCSGGTPSCVGGTCTNV